MPIDDIPWRRVPSETGQSAVHGGADAGHATADAAVPLRGHAPLTPTYDPTPTPVIGTTDHGIAARPPEAAGALVLSEQGVALRVASLGMGIEAFADLLGGEGALPSLANQYLSDGLANAPSISVQTWLHALLYLGRVIAPACRDALMLGDLLHGRMLVAELLQAEPTVSGCARLASRLSGLAPDDAAARQPDIAASTLRGVLASDQGARCLAKLQADMAVLAGWLARGSATDGLPALPPLAPPSALGAVSGSVPRDAASSAYGARPTPTPTPTPPPFSSAFSGADQSARTQRRPVPPAVWRPALEDTGAPPPTVSYADAGPTQRAGADGPWRDGPDATRSLRKRRVVATLVACTLLALALAGAGRLWLNAQASGDTFPAASATSTTQPDAANVDTAGTAPTLATDPPATATVARPTPSPTHTPATKRTAPAPAAATPGATAALGGAAVVPAMSSLTLVCGAPGVSLPLYNSSAGPLTWTIVPPSGVETSGIAGVVNGGKTLTISVWAAAGSPAGKATLYVQSGGRQTPLRLTLPGC